MRVVGDELGLQREEPLEVRNPLSVREQSRIVLEVADVVAQPGAPVAGQAERRLELCAAGEQGTGRRKREVDARRDVAARAPQHQRPAALAERDGADERIVGARLDGAVVDEKAVGDALETAPGIQVAEGDRLVRDVATREHERRNAELGQVGEQQVVQRRVGQHQSQLRHTGRHRRRHRCAPPARSQDDRPRARGEQRALHLAELHQGGGRLLVTGHEREGPVLAPLPRAQFAHGAFVCRVAGQVVAADTLDREHAAARQPFGRCAHGIAGRRGDRIACAVEQARARPAQRAAFG